MTDVPHYTGMYSVFVDPDPGVNDEVYLLNDSVSDRAEDSQYFVVGEKAKTLRFFVNQNRSEPIVYIGTPRRVEFREQEDAPIGLWSWVVTVQTKPGNHLVTFRVPAIRYIEKI